jgi:hypothetical protein
MNMNDQIIPYWLHTTLYACVAFLYLLFLLVIISMSCISKFREKFKNTQLSSSNFVVALCYYAIFRLFYYLSSIFGNDVFHEISLISHHVGSALYYIAFLIFMIYWYFISFKFKRMELIYFRRGENVKQAKLMTKNPRFLLKFVAYLIIICQLIISSLRLVFALLEDDNTMEYISGAASVFHSLLCFLICGIALLLLFMSIHNDSIPDADKRLSMVTLVLIGLNIFLMIIRGVANIVIAIFEFQKSMHSWDIFGVIINFTFPIVFDWIPMFMMGLVGFIQDPPQEGEDRCPEFVRKSGDFLY